MRSYQVLSSQIESIYFQITPPFVWPIISLFYSFCSNLHFNVKNDIMYKLKEDNMFKKVSLVFFSALWFCSLFLFVYRLVEPDTAIDRPADVVVATSPNYMTNPLIDSTENTNQMKYYYLTN